MGPFQTIQCNCHRCRRPASRSAARSFSSRRAGMTYRSLQSSQHEPSLTGSASSAVELTADRNTRERIRWSCCGPASVRYSRSRLFRIPRHDNPCCQAADRRCDEDHGDPDRDDYFVEQHPFNSALDVPGSPAVTPLSRTCRRTRLVGLGQTFVHRGRRAGCPCHN